jgi:1-deoxy-D-xylulose-5-phosphate reductoisomerase
MKTVSVLGSTGSVGTSTLDVIARHPDKFSVQVLIAHKNVELLAVQAKKFCAKMAVIADETLYADLKEALSGTDIECAAGVNAVINAAGQPVDITMAAISGMVGLQPLLAALHNGKTVAIANKEPLVSAGSLVMLSAQKSGATVLPVDSEHNAIFQVFDKSQRQSIARIILTASGGPFRQMDLAGMERATPDMALAHPNWVMGRKISIDSATMMNKALEVIEAHHLFRMPANKIDVIVHPQSTIHSMVEYADGSVLAQMGASDMKVPITYALAWPDRLDGGAQKLDFTRISAVTFEPVDERRFPAIKMAYDSLRDGAAACIAMNAANEVAVELFLGGRIGFMDISRLVQDALSKANALKQGDLNTNLEDILAFDGATRHLVSDLAAQKFNTNRKVS